MAVELRVKVRKSAACWTGDIYVEPARFKRNLNFFRQLRADEGAYSNHVNPLPKLVRAVRYSSGLLPTST